MWKIKDITGQRFGRLIAIKVVAQNKHHNYKWLCQCDCWNETIVASGHLKDNGTKSCGCYCRERISETFKTHGMSKTRFYYVWLGMKARCYHKNSLSYKNYGGRGIKVCKRWMKFENFRDDMLESYKKGLWIERIDNDGNYCPENCCWETIQNQTRNRRNCIKFNGETMADAEKRLGLGSWTIGARIKMGWSKEKAFNTPKNGRLCQKN